MSDEIQAQAESRRQTLTSMIELANKISASQSSLLSGLKGAKHVFGQLDLAADDSLSLQDRRDALQVVHIMLLYKHFKSSLQYGIFSVTIGLPLFVCKQGNSK